MKKGARIVRKKSKQHQTSSDANNDLEERRLPPRVVAGAFEFGAHTRLVCFGLGALSRETWGMARAISIDPVSGSMRSRRAWREVALERCRRELSRLGTAEMGSAYSTLGSRVRPGFGTVCPKPRRSRRRAQSIHGF